MKKIIITALLLLVSLESRTMEEEVIDKTSQDSFATPSTTDDEGYDERDSVTEESYEREDEYDQVISSVTSEIAKNIDIKRMKNCVDKLDRMLKKLLELPPPPSESTEAAKLNYKFAALRNLQHEVCKKWVKGVVDFESMDKNTYNQCSLYLSAWQLTLCNDLKDRFEIVSPLEIKSCLEVLDDFINGIKKIGKKLDSMKEFDKQWKKYFKFRVGVGVDCPKKLKRLDKSIDVLIDKYHEQKNRDSYRLAYNMWCLMKDQNCFKDDGSTDSIPYCQEFEEFVESILGGIDKVIDYFENTVVKGQDELVSARDTLRKAWVQSLLDSGSKDYEAFKECKKSLDFLFSDYVAEDQIVYNAIGTHRRENDSIDKEIEKAIGYVHYAQERLDEAIIDRKNACSRFKDRPKIDAFEEDAQPYKTINRASNKKKKIARECEATIEVYSEQVQELIAEVAKERANFFNVIHANDQSLEEYLVKVNDHFVYVLKTIKPQLVEPVCRMYRNKQGIKDDYTDQTRISLGNLQEDAYIREKSAERMLVEEQLSLDRQKLRKQLLLEKLDCAHVERIESKKKLEEVEELKGKLESKCANNGCSIA